DGPVGLGGAAQQGVDHGGRRELGGGAEAAVAVVGLGGEQADGLVDVGGRDGAWLRGCAAGGELVGDGGGAVEDLLAALLPGLGDGVEHLGEGGQVGVRGGREVGAGVEGVAVRGEPDRHRPAALPGEGDGDVHVDGVDVGALLAVDL